MLSLWERLESKGALYKGTFTGWYCVSEETFYPESRLRKIGENRYVTLETSKPVELVSETNYKFRLSNYLDQIKDWLQQSSPIVPKSRINDLNDAFAEGLPDLSVSRQQSTNPWGIAVPNDPDQTIYVWLDALANYFGSVSLDQVPHVHVIGKDILKFHAIYWPAFLLAAGSPLPERVVTHGHWIVGKEKMSKSLGNVVDPFAEIDRFGCDAFRYLLLRLGRIDSDSDYCTGEFGKRYNNELANVLGNLVSRLGSPMFYPRDDPFQIQSDSRTMRLTEKASKAYDECRFHVGIEEILAFLNETNSQVNERRPWELAKQQRYGELQATMQALLSRLAAAARLLYPIIPDASLAILRQLGTDIHMEGPLCPSMLRSGPARLFPRLDAPSRAGAVSAL